MVRRIKRLVLGDGHLGGTREHAILLGVLLSLTLLTIGGLVVQAWAATRTHRSAAEHVLGDYAALAGWSYSYRVRSLLYLGGTPVLGSVNTIAPDAADAIMSRMRVVADSIRRCDCAPIFVPRYFFHVDLRTGVARIALVDSGVGKVAALRVQRVRAHAMPPATASGRPLQSADQPFRTIAITDSTGSWVALYATGRRSASDPGIIAGFEVRPGQFNRQIFHYAFRDTPLLPRALTRGLPNDSLLSLVIVDSTDRPIFRTRPQYASSFTARLKLDGADSAFAATVTVNPLAANRLVIGGVPRSPLPLLLTLLSISLILIAAAFFIAWRANELAGLRTDFTSSVSHELRTPLTQILLYGEMLGLRRTRTEPERREAISVIVREARRLIHLVENVLHFSKAERRIVHVVPRDQEVGPIIRDVVSAFTPLVAGTGTTIHATTSSGVRAYVDADALRHVLLNLLDNALRHGARAQRVVVGARVAGDRVLVTVDDAGPGVPAADRQRIWEPFVRLLPAGVTTTGSGIGLAVVRELVTLMRGECGVQDAPGGGARFWVRLHLARDRSSNRADGDIEHRSETVGGMG